MASVRDSAELKLIGFEQGVNVRTTEQLLSQTRARFHPTAKPRAVRSHKSEKKASYTLRVRNVPTDMGNGHYTIHLQSCKGSAHDLKIKVVGETSAESVLTVNVNVTSINSLDGKTFQLSDFHKPVATTYVTFTFDATQSTNSRNSALSWSVGLAGISGNASAIRTAVASRIYSVLFQANLDGDLEITPVLDGQTVKLTQNNSGSRGNVIPRGTALDSDHITIRAFTGGKNGELRTLNVGNTRHPIDTNMFALGLLNPPGYYPDEDVTGVAEPYTDTFNSNEQQIKRITFDLNRIINYNTHSRKSLGIESNKKYNLSGSSLDASSNAGNISFSQATGPGSAAAFILAYPTGTVVRISDGLNAADFTIGTNSGTNVSFTLASVVLGSSTISTAGVAAEEGSIKQVLYSASTGISSRIVFDDTLLIVQEHLDTRVKADSLISGVKYEIIEPLDTNFRSVGASSNVIGTSFTATGPGVGQGVARVHQDSAVGKKVFQDGLDNSNPIFATGSFGLENWKMVTKEPDDFVFHDFATESRNWSANKRDLKIMLMCPDLVRGQEDAKRLFMTIEYTLYNDNIPSTPLANPDNTSKIKFYLQKGGPTSKKFAISGILDQNITEVLINPHNPGFADYRVIDEFEDILREALQQLTLTTTFSFEMGVISSDQGIYSITIKEGNARLTSARVYVESNTRASDDFMYLSFDKVKSSFFDDVEEFQPIFNVNSRGNRIRLLADESVYNSVHSGTHVSSDGSTPIPFIARAFDDLSHITNQTTSISVGENKMVLPAGSLIKFVGNGHHLFFFVVNDFSGGSTLKVKHAPIANQQRSVLTFSNGPDSVEIVSSVTESYKVGTRGILDKDDVKNRVYDAFSLAKAEGKIDVTPSLYYATATIKVENAESLHGTTALDDRLTIISSSGVSKTYTIVHGGSGGTQALATGQVIAEGSKASLSVTVSSGHVSIGSIAVNIRSNATRRDVLAELVKAINSKNGHNESESGSVIRVTEVNPVTDDNKATQTINLKQTVGGTEGNRAITKNGLGNYDVVGFTGADEYISSMSIKLTTSGNGTLGAPTPDANFAATSKVGMAPGQNIYSLADFSKQVVDIELRDSASDLSFYLKPNHDVEVRSFGFGKRTSDLKFYDDLSMNGPKLQQRSYPKTLDIDPVFFLTASPEVRFPIQVNNLGNVLGFETDGIIEPLDIRMLMLGRTIAERPLRGLRAEMGGEYSHSSIRNEASLIHNKINFEEASNVAYFDNCPTLSEVVSKTEAGVVYYRDLDLSARQNNVFYSRIPGIIFKNDAKIQPYIDIEERVFQSNPLGGNNPESNEIDSLVSQVQGLNHIDDTNLGAENFRRRAGFDFSSAHPGTDSIAFGGLKYV